MKSHCEFSGRCDKCPEECQPETKSNDYGTVGILARDMGLLYCQMTEERIRQEAEKVITEDAIKNLKNPKKAEKTKKYLCGLVMQKLVSARPEYVQKTIDEIILALQHTQELS